MKRAPVSRLTAAEDLLGGTLYDSLRLSDTNGGQDYIPRQLAKPDIIIFGLPQ